MRLFDTKFGADFLAGVPTEPGVYRFYDVEGALLYVGKATSLRRRLGQYRTAGRKKKEHKRHAPPPFITSRLQQEASRKLGYTPSRTMRNRTRAG